MLPAKYRLRQAENFQKIYRRGQYYFSAAATLKFLPNQKEFSRFAFVVAAKVAKSVARNRVRRQLSEIMRHERAHIRAGFDIIVIVKKALVALDYAEKKKNILGLLTKARLWRE